MSQIAVAPSQAGFVERRETDSAAPHAIRERRQFANSYEDHSPEARELAQAIDQYKLLHRRRFIDCEELLGVMRSLGYSR
jgi:hypothetical protein